MQDELRSFIIDALRKMNYDVGDVTADTELGPAGLDLESLALAELAVQLEDAYPVKFSDDDMESLAVLSLGEFTTVLAERITAGSGNGVGRSGGEAGEGTAVAAADSTA